MQSINDDFVEDGKAFKALPKGQFEEAYEKFSEYLERNFKGEYRRLFDLVLPYAKELRVRFKENAAEKEKHDIVSKHKYDSSIKRGSLRHLGVYLAWISATDPDYAKEIYAAAGIPFRTYQGEPHPAAATEITLKSPGTKSPTNVVADLAPLEGMIKANVPRELKNFYRFDFPEFFKSALGQSGFSARMLNWQKITIVLGITTLAAAVISAGFNFSANQKISDIQIAYERDVKTGELRPYYQSAQRGLYPESSESGLRQLVSNDVLVRHYKMKIEEERAKRTPSLKSLSQLHVLLGQALSSNDIEASNSAYEVAVNLDADSFIARLAYSTSLWGSGATEEAETEYDKAQKLADKTNALEMLLLSDTRSYRAMLSNLNSQEIAKLIKETVDYTDQIVDPEIVLQVRLAAVIRLAVIGEIAGAEKLLENTSTRCDQLDINRIIGLCYEAKSIIATARGHEGEFIRLQKEALTSYQANGAIFAALNIKTNLLQDFTRTHGKEKALQYAEANLDEARQENYRFGEMQALRNLSSLYSFYFQRHDLGLEYALQELPLREASPDRKSLGELHEWIGLKYSLLDEPKKSAQHYEMALNIAVDLNHEYSTLVRSSKLSSTYSQLGRQEEAKHFYALGDELLASRYKQPSDIIDNQDLLDALINSGDARQIPLLEKLLAHSEENELFTAQIYALGKLALIHTGSEDSLKYRTREIEFLKKYGVETALADKYFMLGLSAKAMGQHESAWEAFNSAKDVMSAQDQKIDANLAFELLGSGAKTGLLNTATRKDLFEIVESVRLEDLPVWQSQSVVVDMIETTIQLRREEKLTDYMSFAAKENVMDRRMVNYVAVALGSSMLANDVLQAEMYSSYFRNLIAHYYGQCSHCELLDGWLEASDDERPKLIQEFLDAVEQID